MNARSLKASILGIMAVALLAAGVTSAVGAPERTAAPVRSATTGVVVVHTTLAYGGQAAGTGVVLTSSGAVLTNNHVIRGASRVRVTDTSTGRTYTVEEWQADPYRQDAGSSFDPGAPGGSCGPPPEATAATSAATTSAATAGTPS